MQRSTHDKSTEESKAYANEQLTVSLSIIGEGFDLLLFFFGYQTDNQNNAVGLQRHYHTKATRHAAVVRAD